MRPLDVLLAVSVPAIWGLGFTLSKAALDQFPPILLMGLRFTLTALILVWFVRPPLGHLRKLFLIALVSATIQYGLTFYGLRGLDASTAVLVVQIEAPFLAILGAVFLQERIGWRRAGGMALAFVGVGLIAGEPKLQGVWGPLLLVLGGAFTWAVGQVMIATLKTVGGFTLIAWVAVFAAPQLLFASLLIERDQWTAIREADLFGWGVILYLGVIMTAVGYGIWYRLLGRFQVNQVAPFLLLLPLTTVASGMTLLDERLTAMIAFGGALVLTGVAVMTIEPRRRPVPAGGERP